MELLEVVLIVVAVLWIFSNCDQLRGKAKGESMQEITQTFVYNHEVTIVFDRHLHVEE
jgi:hypothetical protein